MKVVFAVLVAALVLAGLGLLFPHFHIQSSTHPLASPSSIASPSPNASPRPSSSPQVTPSPASTPRPSPTPTSHAPLTAPLLVSPGNDTIQNSRMVTLQWTPVAGADHYQVEVQFCNHNDPCTDTNTSTLGTFTSPSSSMVLTQLQNYLNVNVRWRVVAIDSHGTLGPASAWGRFHAVLST